MGKNQQKHFSFTDAAEKVLQKYANKKQMHYKDMIGKALKNKWIITQGLTPGATLIAVIGLENRRKIARGEEPRFYIYGGGYYGLAAWQPKGLERQIEQTNKKVKEDLLKKIKSSPPEDFEKLIGELLPKLGFDNVEVTNYRGDGGIDVLGELVVGDIIRTKMVIQAKRWKNNVQAKTVRELRGSLTQHQQGLVIITSDFSKGAVEEANDPQKAPIALMDGEQLVELMVEYNVGIMKKELNLISLDERWGVGKEPDKKLKIKKNINIFGITRGKRYNAKLINLKRVKLNRKVFDSPSSAAKSVCGYPIDGWHFWRFIHNGEIKTIDYLRKSTAKGRKIN